MPDQPPAAPDPAALDPAALSALCDALTAQLCDALTERVARTVRLAVPGATEVHLMRTGTGREVICTVRDAHGPAWRAAPYQPGARLVPAARELLRLAPAEEHDSAVWRAFELLDRDAALVALLTRRIGRGTMVFDPLGATGVQLPPQAPPAEPEPAPASGPQAAAADARQGGAERGAGRADVAGLLAALEAAGWRYEQVSPHNGRYQAWCRCHPGTAMQLTLSRNMSRQALDAERERLEREHGLALDIAARANAALSPVRCESCTGQRDPELTRLIGHDMTGHRITGKLTARDYRTVAEVAATPDAELGSIPGLGAEAMARIRAAIPFQDAPAPQGLEDPAVLAEVLGPETWSGLRRADLTSLPAIRAASYGQLKSAVGEGMIERLRRLTRTGDA